MSQQRQGTLTSYLTSVKKAKPQDRAATPVKASSKVSPASVKSTKKAKLLQPTVSDNAQESTVETPKAGLAAPISETSKGVSSTIRDLRARIAAREKASTAVSPTPLKPVEKVARPAAAKVETKKDSPQVVSKPARVEVLDAALKETEKDAQPTLATKPLAAISPASLAVKTATPIRASDKYRHLVRKRKASPVSSDDEIYVPPPRTSAPLNTPTKAPAPITFKSAQPSPAKAKPVPGYIKYRHLVRQSADLKFPDKYEVLEKLFAALEQTMVFNQGQGRQSIFVKIKKPVENMSDRSFELHHLAQILHIFPEAYNVSAIRCLHEGEYVNTISLDINYSMSSALPGQDDGVVPAAKKEETGGAAFRQVTFIASQMEKRRAILHERLLTLMKAEHDAFLKKEQFEVEKLDKPLRQWHPKFDVDAVPDLPEASLPKVEALRRNNSNHLLLRGRSTPTKADASPKSASGTEDSSRKGIAGQTSELGLPKSNASSTDRSHTTPEADQDTPTSGAAGRPVSKASSLLERIRAKEKKRIHETMFGQTEQQIHKKALFARLPQFVDSISFYFTSNKKKVAHLSEVVRVLTQSLKLPMSDSEITEHVNLLQETVPEWIEITALDTHYTAGGGPKLLQVNKTAMTTDEVKRKCKEAADVVLAPAAAGTGST